MKLPRIRYLRYVFCYVNFAFFPRICIDDNENYGSNEYVVGFCFLQNHKIADISNKFSSHYDVVEQQLKSSTIGKLNSVNVIIVTFKSCFSFQTHNFTVASNLTIEDYAPINGLPQERGVGQPRGIRLLKRMWVGILTSTTIPRVGNFPTAILKSCEDLGMSDE